jgi:hypothetical protein
VRAVPPPDSETPVTIDADAEAEDPEADGVVVNWEGEGGK